MSTKTFHLIAGFALASGFLFTLSEGQAQKFQMTGTFDPAPNTPTSKINSLLVYSYDKLGRPVPNKTIKIRNNGAETVYPIMRGVNNTKLPSDPSKGLYDPYDTPNIEYRGYIGYKGGAHDKNYYYGLKPGETILVRVPLAFWDGGRMGILTEGKYLKPGPGVPNIYSYDAEHSEVMITESESDPKDPDVIKDGVVLWYKSPVPVGPVSEAPDQLLEWTYRDKDYLSQLPTANEIPAGQLITLVNYDVSYVDTLFLPLAMEALDVPLPQPPIRKPQPYGYIGANYKAKELENKIKTFTLSTNSILGTYFGGKGWPIYNMPNDDLKIPSGDNVFSESPLANKISKYDGTWYVLSSGGDKNSPWFVNIGGQGKASSGNLITLSTDPLYTEKIKMIAPGMTVVGFPAGVVAAGTKVVKVNLSGTSTVPTTVEIDQLLQGSEAGANFNFIRPIDDYASNAMMKIWYSWAKYYLDHIVAPLQQTIAGTVKTNYPVLNFSAPQGNLVVGMSVTGPGLPNPDPGKSRGPVVVLEIAQDEKSVTLSQLPSGDFTGSYVFDPPQPLQSSPPAADLLDFANFPNDPVEPSRVPLEFAKKVYLLMAAFSQVPKNPNPDVKTPYEIELMVNVIGGNFGYIFEPNNLALTDGGLVISSTLRDILKSVLRGVTDFTKFTEYDGTTRIWYPDPSAPRGNQTFNVYNLDPYVWFVHVILGFSGYGFSLDDDTADVGAGGASELLLTVGGRPKGTPGANVGTIKTPENPDQWTIQTVYGPVAGTGAWDPTKTRTFPLNFSGASNTTPIVVSSTNHGLLNGDKVFIEGAQGNTAANTPTTGPNANKPWTISNVTTNTFELVGSSGNGTYTGGGSWNTGPLYYVTFTGADIDGVYWRVKGDDRKAGFEGATMTGPGADDGEPVRVIQLGDSSIGQLGISRKLTRPNGQPLPAGKNYKWTFSGK